MSVIRESRTLLGACFGTPPIIFSWRRPRTCVARRTKSRSSLCMANMSRSGRMHFLDLQEQIAAAMDFCTSCNAPDPHLFAMYTAGRRENEIFGRTPARKLAAGERGYQYPSAARPRRGGHILNKKVRIIFPDLSCHFCMLTRLSQDVCHAPLNLKYAPP